MTDQRVFLVVLGNWQDYAGGGDELQAVHATREGALDTVREVLKERGRKPSQKPNANGFWHISGSPSSEWLAIYEEAVKP